MSKLTMTLAVAGYVLGAFGPLTGAANASSQSAFPAGIVIVSAQEDCKEGETWNEETQKCEPKAE